MKSLVTTLPLTVALGGLVALGCLVLPLDGDGRTAWLLGAFVSSLVGALALVIKTQLTTLASTGTAGLKALLTGQVLSFMLRLLAVLVGALAMKQSELSPMAFVIAFFVVSLAQQVLETKSLLAARNPVKSSEVTS